MVQVFWHIGLGHHGHAEAQFGRFLETFLTAWRRAHLAHQTDLAKRKKALGQRLAAQGRGDRQQHCQVGCRLADAHAAHRVHKHVLVHAGHTGVAVQHGQQHGQAVLVQPHAQATRRGATGIHQRLDFHQHGPCAFQRNHHTAARHRLGVLAQENRAGVAHAFEALFGHGKHTDFIDRTKTVLDGTHQPETAVRVAFKVQHRVHHVLQHARPGQRAFFGHMAHQHNAYAAGFGRAGEMRRAFAHLRHRAGGGG